MSIRSPIHTEGQHQLPHCPGGWRVTVAVRRRGPRANQGRLEGRQHLLPAALGVPPALQHRTDAGPLSRVHLRTRHRRVAERPRGHEPDRVRVRGPRGVRAVRAGVCEERRGGRAPTARLRCPLATEHREGRQGDHHGLREHRPLRPDGERRRPGLGVLSRPRHGDDGAQERRGEARQAARARREGAHQPHDPPRTPSRRAGRCWQAAATSASPGKARWTRSWRRLRATGSPPRRAPRPTAPGEVSQVFFNDPDNNLVKIMVYPA